MLINQFSALKKQYVFVILFMLFLLHSMFVYTEGTSHKKGRSFFTQKAKEGKLIFQEYNCIACHQVYGLGGYMGPDLTNALSKENGSIIANAYLRSGTDKMPNFHLSEHEIEALLAYLTYLDQASTYPVIDFSIHWTGTIDENNKK